MSVIYSNLTSALRKKFHPNCSSWYYISFFLHSFKAYKLPDKSFLWKIIFGNDDSSVAILGSLIRYFVSNFSSAR